VSSSGVIYKGRTSFGLAPEPDPAAVDVHLYLPAPHAAKLRVRDRARMLTPRPGGQRSTASFIAALCAGVHTMGERRRADLGVAT
jgi:hypothetical protein